MTANHVLVNEYLPHQGIMPHTDGPLFYPVISTISCGSHTVLRFHEKLSFYDNNITNINQNNEQNISESKIVCQLLLEPRSLLIVSDDLYSKYLHSIAEVSQDLIASSLANLELCTSFNGRVGELVERSRRISLTIRHVPKTSRIHLRLGH